MKSKKAFIFFSLFTLISVVLSLNTGASGWGIKDSFIVMNVRVPRIIAALIVGAGLGVSGAVFQALLKNPLAAPYITGTSAGAAFGVALAALAGLQFLAPAAGFICAVGLSIIVYLIASSSERNAPESLLLAGVIISSLVSALTFLIMVLNRHTVYRILFFLMGSLQFVSRKELLFAFIITFAGFIFIMYNWRRLNIMTLGDEEALSLGVDAPKTRKVLFGVSALVVAAAVSLAGIIGFVGLAVPHIVRMATGADHRRLLPFSAIFGGGFLVFSDALARGVFAPMEIPVGIITAVFGAPFFLYLLLKR